MDLSICKSSIYHCYCSHRDCPENLKYFFKTVKKGWKRKMKMGQTIGIIRIGNSTEIYCRDCVDKVYQEFKSVFDSKLWIFQ